MSKDAEARPKARMVIAAGRGRRLHMNRFYSWRTGVEKPLSGGSAPPLVVRTQGYDRSLPAGPSYLVGRDPECDSVITDVRVSLHHAILRLEDGRWVLADNGSTNGTYAGDRRVDRLEINGECLVRLSDPADGPVLSCAATGAASSGRPTCQAWCGRCPPPRCASAGRRITTSCSPTSACPATMPNCAT